MNMDYKEPRNGDFASYVEELSRHFDMKEQAVNPDFSSGFPSQLVDATARNNRKAAQAGTQRNAARAAAVTDNQADTSFPVPASGKQHAGFDTRPAAPAKRQGKSFPSLVVLGLIIMAMFIVARSVNPNADGVGGPLIFILVILFIIFRRIRNAAKRFPTSVNTKKQT
ncbi:hypothetical protein [Advenella mimigardefordensis]|uniref:Putative membrane protein n=1 Tax=Advenella mimigardefordensis (strain DSM 17166 / LMG 22922 / DPN7) TaxID=1247726 RepID=W0PA13_ADVMD|nr:hypothetical protein [Advenella mimigardefordensis]AHG63679.1 putative membrane protein [Advenella mimigardefordensis DPN7]